MSKEEQFLTRDEVEALVIKAIAKSPYGDGLWGRCAANHVMLAFDKEKLICKRDPSLPDTPSRRKADAQFAEFDF